MKPNDGREKMAYRRFLDGPPRGLDAPSEIGDFYHLTKQPKRH